MFHSFNNSAIQVSIQPNPAAFSESTFGLIQNVSKTSKVVTGKSVVTTIYIFNPTKLFVLFLQNQKYNFFKNGTDFVDKHYITKYFNRTQEIKDI